MNPDIIMLPPGAETAEAYHASGAWGSTLISTFLSSPRLADLTRTRAYRPERTAAMGFGEAFHALLDPRSDFSRRYHVGPAADHRTKVWKDAVAAAATGGVTLLDPDDHVALEAMRASVLANPVAAALLDGAEQEIGFRGPSGYGPFQVQCRADVLRRWDWLADVKTTSDLEGFRRSVETYGYHRQAALYRWIVHRACGTWLPFSFIVVETVAPLYRCRVIDLTEDYLTQGWQEVEAALIDIGSRTEANDWADHHDADVVDVPAWKRQALEAA